jgi:small subunit ribosomal protein S20
MPHHHASIKHVRSTKRATVRNKAATSLMRSAVRKVLDAKKSEGAEALLREAVSVLDKNVKRKLVHKNNAARKKAQLYRAIQKLAK